MKLEGLKMGRKKSSHSPIMEENVEGLKMRRKGSFYIPVMEKKVAHCVASLTCCEQSLSPSLGKAVPRPSPAFSSVIPC